MASDAHFTHRCVKVIYQSCMIKDSDTATCFDNIFYHFIYNHTVTKSNRVASRFIVRMRNCQVCGSAFSAPRSLLLSILNALSKYWQCQTFFAWKLKEETQHFSHHSF